MNTSILTKTQKTLIRCLKVCKVSKEDAVGLAMFTEDDEQVLLIHYMNTHPEATPQEIMNEGVRLIKKRKNMMK